MPRSACTSSKRARGAELDGQAAALLVVGAFQHLRDAGHRAVLENPGLMLGLVGVAGHERLLDLLGIGLRVFGHQRIADPKPQRLERRARDPAAMLVIGAIVDQERLDRLEEQPRRIAEARGLGLAFAQASPQLGQNHFGPGRARAVQQPALELGNQQRPRSGLQLPEIGSQLFGGSFGLAGHSGTTRTIIQRF